MVEYQHMDTMTSYQSRAQHFVECDECEDNPANFFCKTCPGNLCEKCKSQHKIRKITKNHEIKEFGTDNEELVDFLYCSDHIRKRIECYCDPCKKPVCTDCIVLFHNGHVVRTISSAYKEIKEEMQTHKDAIDQYFLPKYTWLLGREAKKRSELKKQANKIQKEIRAYTQNIIEMVKSIGEKTVQDLHDQEKNGLRQINETSDELKKKISRLKEIEKNLSGQIKGNPGMQFFTPMNSNLLGEFETFPKTFNYKLHTFQVGRLPSLVAVNYGALADLSIIQEEEDDSESDMFDVD
uniref:Tripartite motif-containing protein 45-like isoform X1 n=2 Tax=Crassostrea virginica TaxID=6565 RepID=A0A8B8CCM6_CRAVI|nr:tripartite motif-containing protein 45-like isoform X1 [Crassostrea virginica]